MSWPWSIYGLKKVSIVIFNIIPAETEAFSFRKCINSNKLTYFQNLQYWWLLGIRKKFSRCIQTYITLSFIAFSLLVVVMSSFIHLSSCTLCAAEKSETFSFKLPISSSIISKYSKIDLNWTVPQLKKVWEWLIFILSFYSTSQSPYFCNLRGRKWGHVIILSSPSSADTVWIITTPRP